MSEHAKIEVVANDGAELLDHLKGVTQQIALPARKQRWSHQRSRGAGRCSQLAIKPQRQQETKGLAQLAGEVGLQDADFAQSRDALVGRRFQQAMLDGETADAVNDRKEATFLEVQRVALSL